MSRRRATLHATRWSAVHRARDDAAAPAILAVAAGLRQPGETTRAVALSRGWSGRGSL